MLQELQQLVHAREGHFLLESGHHGSLWLDLELLCVNPSRIQPFLSELVNRLVNYRLDAVCGPLVEGAFLAMGVANDLDVPFFYTEQLKPNGDLLYPIGYRLPTAQRPMIKGKRVAIVNDVINAGSAVRGTYFDVQSCSATIVAMASLLTLGDAARAFADEWKIDLITIGSQPNPIWKPEVCPLCADGIPLKGFNEKGPQVRV